LRRLVEAILADTGIDGAPDTIVRANPRAAPNDALRLRGLPAIGVRNGVARRSPEQTRCGRCWRRFDRGDDACPRWAANATSSKSHRILVRSENARYREQMAVFAFSAKIRGEPS
jgi:hypothetical protein